MSNDTNGKSEHGQTNPSPWPLLLLPWLLLAFQTVLPTTETALLASTRCRIGGIATHNSSLEVWRLAIKNIRRLDSVFGNSDSAIEEPHQMTRTFRVLTLEGLRTWANHHLAPSRLAGIVREHLSVFLAHSDEKLVYGHGRVDCDFAAEEILDVMLLCMSRQEGREDNIGVRDGVHESLWGHVRKLML